MLGDLDSGNQEAYPGPLDAAILDHLNSVVHFLHAEGLYASEEALLREIEERYHIDKEEDLLGQTPDELIASEQKALVEGTINFQPNLQEKQSQDGLESAEKLVEAWRSKSTTPVASPKKRSEIFQVCRPGSAPAENSVSAEGVDEYEGDDDVGYWRVEVAEQEAGFTIDLERLSTDGAHSTRAETPCSSNSQQYAPLPSSQSGSPAFPGPHSPSASQAAVHVSLEPCLEDTAQQAWHCKSGQFGAPAQEDDQKSSAPGRFGGGFANLDRHAGTASWVYDRSNSVGLNERIGAAQLAQLSPQQWSQPAKHAGGDSSGSGPVVEADVRRTGSITLTAPVKSSCDYLELPTRDSNTPAGGQLSDARDSGDAICKQQSDDDIGNGGASPAVDDCNISRVSSLSETMLQDALALLVVEDRVEEEQPVCSSFAANGRQAAPREELQGGAGMALAQVSEGPLHCLEASTAPDAAAEVLDLVLPGGAQSHQVGDEFELCRLVNRPTAVRTDAKQQAGKAAKEGRRRHRRRRGKRGGKGKSSSEAGSVGEAEAIDYADPFTFPVTSPSEAAMPDSSRMFQSWPSQQNFAGPEFKESYYSTDDDTSHYHGSRQHLLQSPMSWDQQADSLGNYDFDQDAFERKYQVVHLPIIARRHCTGFEQTKELPVHVGDVIAGRYQVVDLLGQAAFSRAVQALDTKTGMLVCLKIVKNNKDYFDQSLDEIRLLQYINSSDPGDEHHILRLYDFFYFKEHLVLVCELLRANLYEFQKHNRESNDPNYFTLPRIQSIAKQVLVALAFLHSLSLMHADLKPENILIKSYSRCEVKVIDLGSSCYTSDHLSAYVQSRSYRSPEVVLGTSYDQKIDIWSLGCIIAELCSGRVLFQNDSLATLLARLEGILGPIPLHMIQRGRLAHHYFTQQGDIFERERRTGRFTVLRSKRTSLRARTGITDDLMLDFLRQLLQIDPTRRPTAEEALQHPWLKVEYGESDCPRAS